MSNFSAKFQLLFLHSAFVKCLKKKGVGNKRGTAHPLARVFNKTYDSVRMKVLCGTLIDFGTPTNIFSSTGMCLDENYSKVLVGKNLSDIFQIKKDIEFRFRIFCLPGCYPKI